VLLSIKKIISIFYAFHDPWRWLTVVRADGQKKKTKKKKKFRLRNNQTAPYRDEPATDERAEGRVTIWSITLLCAWVVTKWSKVNTTATTTAGGVDA